MFHSYWGLCILKPVLCIRRSHCNEKPTYHTRESPRAAKHFFNVKKNKEFSSTNNLKSFDFVYYFVHTSRIHFPELVQCIFHRVTNSWTQLKWLSTAHICIQRSRLALYKDINGYKISWLEASSYVLSFQLLPIFCSPNPCTEAYNLLLTPLFS